MKKSIVMLILLSGFNVFSQSHDRDRDLLRDRDFCNSNYCGRSPSKPAITAEGYVEAVVCVQPSGGLDTGNMSFYVPMLGFLNQDTPKDFIALMFFSGFKAVSNIEANVKNMTRGGDPIFTFKFSKNKMVFDTKNKTAVFVDSHNKRTTISCEFRLIKNRSKLINH